MKPEHTGLRCPLCRGCFYIYRSKDLVRMVCDSNECLEVADRTELGAIKQIVLVCETVFSEKIKAILQASANIDAALQVVKEWK